MAQVVKKGSIYLQADSPAKLVEQLRGMSPLVAGESLSAFMHLFARRFEQLSPGQTVRTDCPDNFMADLVSYGWIKLRHNPEAKG